MMPQQSEYLHVYVYIQHMERRYLERRESRGAISVCVCVYTIYMYAESAFSLCVPLFAKRWLSIELVICMDIGVQVFFEYIVRFYRDRVSVCER